MLTSDFKRINIFDGDIDPHQRANLGYLHRLQADKLLKSFYLEAGALEPGHPEPDDYEGCEWIASSIRGHFTGHYLSALAMAAVYFNDKVLKTKAEYMVDELIKCQTENGGGWIAAFPEKYLSFLKRGKNYRVPNYVIHKVVMGLFHVWKYLKYQPAKDALLAMVDYLDKWSGALTAEEMRSIVNFETGGLLEILGEVYAMTGEDRHKKLMERFVRRDLFDRLIDGVDGLTNMHANTTVPEAVAVARLYEITGEEYYKKAAEAYYDCAVRQRGYFVTGGNNSGECYMPPHRQLNRMSEKTQEHCTSYNLVRLADFLYRWTGEAEYADYMERVIFNSLLAQNNTDNGVVAYWLPITGGAKKVWQSETKDFPCCMGTSVQSNASYCERFLYHDETEVVLAQIFEFEGEIQIQGSSLKLRLGRTNGCREMTSMVHYFVNEYERPRVERYAFSYDHSEGKPFTLKIRKPTWTDKIEFSREGKAFEPELKKGYYVIPLTEKTGAIDLGFERKLRMEKMDDGDLYAFMFGPKVLAGLIPCERTLNGDPSKPQEMLRAYAENEWGAWKYTFYTKNQYENFRVLPVCDIMDDTPYTIYFPVRKLF